MNYGRTSTKNHSTFRMSLLWRQHSHRLVFHFSSKHHDIMTTPLLAPPFCRPVGGLNIKVLLYWIHASNSHWIIIAIFSCEEASTAWERLVPKHWLLDCGSGIVSSVFIQTLHKLLRDNRTLTVPEKLRICVLEKCCSPAQIQVSKVYVWKCFVYLFISH